MGQEWAEFGNVLAMPSERSLGAGRMRRKMFT